MSRALALAALSLSLSVGLGLSGCGSSAPTPDGRSAAAVPVKRVLYVQIDGLTPGDLDAYLAHPDARTPGRALHQWLDLAAPEAGGAPQAGQVRQATVGLPATGDTTAATVLTGQPPARHQVYGRRDLPAVPPAVVLPATDMELKSLPGFGLVALRFGGLARALQAEGPRGALGAIGAIDARLGALLPTLPADTVAVIMGGHGGVSLPNPKRVLAAHLASALRRPSAKGIHAAGGLVLFDSLEPDEAKLLAGPDMIVLDALVRMAEDGPLIWDADLNTLRPLRAADHASAPDLIARLTAAAPAGAWVGIVARSQGFELTADKGDAPKMGIGGPSLDEAQVALAFAGPSLRGRAPSPAAWRAVDVGVTLRGLLGQPTAGLAGSDLSAALRTAGPAVAPGAPEVDGDQVRVAVPFIAALGGPSQLSMPAGAAPERAVAILGALARGIAAARAGLWPRADAELAAAVGLPAEAEAWRTFFVWWAARTGDMHTGDEASPEAPGAGYPAALAAAIDDSLPAVDGSNWSAERAALLTALAGPRPSGLRQACSETPVDMAAAKARDAEALKAAGLPGFAAQAWLAAALFAADPAAAAAHRAAALAALAAPEAAWGVGAAAVTLSVGALTAGQRPDAAAQHADAGVVVNQRLRQLITLADADRGPGARGRMTQRLAALTTGAGDADPMLLNAVIQRTVGPDRTGAAALVAALLLNGGLTELFSGHGLARLGAMERMLEETLGSLLKTPVGDLRPADRLAAALAMWVRAARLALSGDMPGAFAALSAAEEGLSDEAMLALRAEALAQPEADRDALQRWAPGIALVTRIGKAIALGVAGQAPLARAMGHAAADSAGRWLQVELADAQATETLGAPVRDLVVFLHALVDVATAPEAERRAALMAALDTGARTRIELPEGDAPGAELARWLSLVTVIARDALWVVQSLRDDRMDRAGLDRATAELEALAQAWRPESAFGTAGLVLGLAAQRALIAAPEIAALEEITLVAVAERVPAVMAALAALRGDIEAARPAAARRAGLIEGDLSSWLLDLLVAVLDAGPRALADSDALLALAEGHVRSQLATVRGQSGNRLRPVLAMLEAWLLEAAGRGDDAVALMVEARDWLAGTPLAGQGWLMDLLAVRFATRTGSASARDAAVGRVEAGCPGLTWQIVLARAFADPAAAPALLAKARGEAARRRAGPGLAALRLVVVDGQDVVNANIELQVAGLALGGGAGTFQLGAGTSTNPSGETGLNLSLSPSGSAHDFAAETLMYEGWLALVAGDDAAADRALAALLDLLQFGTDPGFLSDAPAPSPAGPYPGTPAVRAPRALAWVAALASLRGHAQVGTRLMQAARTHGAEGAGGPYGVDSVCDDPAPAGDAEDAFSESLRCVAPAGLKGTVPAKARAAFSRWVSLQARPAEAPAKAQAAARRALARAWSAVPAKAPASAAAVAKLLADEQGGPASWGPQAEVVLAGPHRCGSLLPLLGAGRLPRSRARPVASACGAVAARLLTLEGLPPDHPTADALATARLLSHMGGISAEAQNGMWRALDRWARSGPADQRRPRAEALAAVAAEAGAAGAALELRAVALAARVAAGEAVDATPVLDEALRTGAGLRATRVFLKRAVFTPARAGEAAAVRLGLK